LSFRAEGPTDASFRMLKKTYPSALPVFSVDTHAEAVALIATAGTLGWENERYGVPHILRAEEIPAAPRKVHLDGLMAAFDRVGEYLNEWHRGAA
jgi:hypothetical protein